MNWYAGFLGKYRLLLAGCVLAVTLLTGYGATRVRFEDEPRNVLRRHGSDFERLEQLYRDFGPDDNDVLVVIDGDQLFTNQSLSVIREIVDQAREIDGVESVFSIFDVRRRGSGVVPLVPRAAAEPETLEDVRRRALSHPAVAGHLLSDDATTMLAIARLSGDSLSMAYLEPRIAQLRSIANQSLRDVPLRVRLSGHQVARLDLSAMIWREGPQLLVLGGLVSTLIAIVLFRRLTAVLIALAGPAVGVTWTLGVFGLAGEQINTLSTVLPTLVFVIGFTDSVHLVIDIRRHRVAGETSWASVRKAICEVGPACALTSLTTMVGFGSLVITEVEAVQRFGIDCACGTLLSFLAVITVVPLLASTPLGRRMVAAGTPISKGPPPASPRLANQKPHLAYAWILRHHWLVTASSLLVSLGLLLLALNLQPDIQWMEMLPAGSDTKQVWQHCDEKLGGTLLCYVVVEWPAEYDLDSPDVLRALGDVHSVLAVEPTLRSPFSVLNLLLSFTKSGTITGSQIRQLERVPVHLRNRVLRRDLSRAVVTAYVPDAGAAELLPVFSSVERELATLQSRFPGFQMHLTGTSVVAARNVQRIIGDLGRSLGLATAIIFVVMSFALRSIRLGLTSAIPNAFPLAFAAGVLVVIGQPLRLASAMTFSICLGIAVDDTIHFLTRFRRELLAGSDVELAIVRTLRTVGVAMLVTSVTLLGGFGVMTISQMPSIQTFSRMASLAILAALFGDLVMLPALLLCFVRSPRWAAGAAAEETL